MGFEEGKMIKDIFKNYEAFYNMVLSTTIMSNTRTDEFVSDAKKIIDFIGKAYRFSDEFTAFCSSIILDELVKLSKTTDQQVVYSRRQFGDVYDDMDSLFDIKGDVLATIQNIGVSRDGNISEGWFDYKHYKTYQADIRFAKINITSASGNIIATRQVGLLLALGIGCEQDFDRAILRLTQCALWGDIAAMHYLAYVYELTGADKKAQLYYEVSELASKYLYSGCTVLSESDKKAYSEDARTYYAYISSIKQDVVQAHEKYNIDFSFIEAIMSSELDYYKRMNYINNYAKQEWKEITNSSLRPSKRIGFN